VARERTLSQELSREEAEAIRVLLARPLLDGADRPDEFRLVVGCRDRLAEWFESTCGWRLVVDVPGGFARLFKRTDRPDETRPAHRTRGALAPFDRRRYELLCLLCAELSSHPPTTIGLLAQALGSVTTSYPTARFDTTKQRERAAFVDALKLLARWGVVAFSSGEIDAYVGSDRANAIVSASTSRLHHLLATTQAPSSSSATDTCDAIDTLTREPRYGHAPSAAPDIDPEQRVRWVRHSLARSLLDDPVLYFDDLSDDRLAYISTPGGRRWLRDRALQAGFVLEERAEGMMAVDEDGLCSDIAFPAPGSTSKQVALLVIDCFVERDGPGRQLTERSMVELTAAVTRHLDANPRWAMTYRDEGGARRLAAEAVDALEQLRLVRRTGERVRPRPALARYTAGRGGADRRAENDAFRYVTFPWLEEDS
jgi:uncharacterized protein (TIGR02678 family)